MQIFLETRSDSNAGAKIRLVPGKPLRVGRTDKADHPFPGDKQMSGLHFAIEVSEKGCRLLDLNSSNGTFLNGARVTEALLANGDEIRAGNTVFVIRMLRDDALPTASSEVASPKPAPENLDPPKPAPIHPATVSPVSSQRGGLPSFSAPPAVPATPLKPGQLPSFPNYSPPAPSHVESSGPVPPAPSSTQPRLQDLLAKDFQPLYVLLDASREPSVLKVILESKEEYQSLYEGAQGAQLAHFAPYLVRVPQESALLDTLVHQAWSKSWGVFLTSDTPLKDLRTHFRHFLTVKLPDGQQVYFRYYDPRVLRLFLPTCLPEETNQFFGPVKHFLIEADDPATALHFTRGPKGAAQKELHLAPA
jgi:pSer/pThr/pTyr-binding forkhead associated (FHA) protein